MVRLHAEHDVTIVGAGITGLTTALLCARAGLKVAVVDSGLQLGSRDGLMPSAARTQSAVHYRVRQWWGTAAVQTYAAELARGQELLDGLATELEIPFAHDRSATTTVDGSTAFWLRRESQVLRGAGVRLDFADEVGLPFEIRPCLVLADQTQLDPLPYRDALAQAVVAHGGELHSTMVPGRRMVSTTVLPMVDQFALRPRLSPATWRWIALRGAGLPETDVELLDDGGRQLLRRAGADGEPQLWIGSRADSGEDFVTRHFPDAEPVARWQAQTAATVDGLPLVGHSGLNKQNLVACGFDAWELVTGTAAARQLADHLTGVQETFPWSPLRVPGAGAIGRALSRNLRHTMRLSVMPPNPADLRS